MISLPIDHVLPAIVQSVRESRAVVVTAAPGAGKTTRVPPALAGDGRVLVLQPRRVAARSIAKRIAEEQGWTLGQEVGWHVRLERRFSKDTRLIVATEGILTARIQDDPLLGDLTTVVIDEFHERSIHADVGLALAREAWRARPDLRIVVMSATLDAERVASFLGNCPIVNVPGRLFAVETRYQPGVSVDTAIRRTLPVEGAVLVFLPGAPEIHRVAEKLGELERNLSIVPLHGGLGPEEQDRAILPAPGPRVILATNIAETTLTVPDVRVVIDTGLHKVARYDAERAIDSLETERISADAATQRAGRAGRTAAGVAIRLWDSLDRLRPHREPEIARVDLASVVLDVIAWGGDPAAFEWFEAPPVGAIAAAVDLLKRLGALDEAGRMTDIGRAIRRLPLHPRLAKLVITGGGTPELARAAAFLSERRTQRRSSGTVDCDLLAAVEDKHNLPEHVRRVAVEVHRLAQVRSLKSHLSGALAFRRAVLAAYPDRVARRRAPRSDLFLLASGVGARLGRESGVFDHEWIVALDVSAGSAVDSSGGQLPIIRMATGIEREWLVPSSSRVEHTLDEAKGTVRARRVDRYGEIVMGERPASVDEDVRSQLIADAERQRPLTERELKRDRRTAVDNDAPEDLLLPSGRRARLDYRADGRIVAAVKLQELFGLADTPRLGKTRIPITFELLSPAGRPVQVTADLRSFWTNGYPEVRRELRARYPRHPWPDDPWTAKATHRTLRKPGK